MAIYLLKTPILLFLTSIMSLILAYQHLLHYLCKTFLDLLILQSSAERVYKIKRMDWWIEIIMYYKLNKWIDESNIFNLKK